MASLMTIRPEELFFLGEIMEAEYIDYSYIQAMEDVQQNFDVAKKDAIAGLGEKGLVKESISGRLKVKPVAEELFGPVFFGEKETVAVVLRNGAKQEAYTKFFHFKDADITCITMEDGLLNIEKKALVEVEAFAKTLFDGAATNPMEDSKLAIDDITDIVKVKSGIVRVGAKEQTWCIADGVLFAGDHRGEPVVTSIEDATAEAVQILKGE